MERREWVINSMELTEVAMIDEGNYKVIYTHFTFDDFKCFWIILEIKNCHKDLLHFTLDKIEIKT